MYYAYFAELPRKRRKPALIVAPVEAPSESQAFDKLWLRYPRALSIAVLPLKLIHGCGRVVEEAA